MRDVCSYCRKPITWIVSGILFGILAIVCNHYNIFIFIIGAPLYLSEFISDNIVVRDLIAIVYFELLVCFIGSAFVLNLKIKYIVIIISFFLFLHIALVSLEIKMIMRNIFELLKNISPDLIPPIGSK